MAHGTPAGPEPAGAHSDCAGEGRHGMFDWLVGVAKVQISGRMRHPLCNFYILLGLESRMGLQGGVQTTLTSTATKVQMSGQMRLVRDWCGMWLRGLVWLG